MAFRDIAEEKNADEERNKLTAEFERRVVERTAALEDAYQELEAFSYSVSHDLRSSLRRIDGICGLLREECGHNLDAQAHDYLARIHVATRRMEAVIDDLLMLSRTTRVEITRSNVDLGQLAEAVVEELRSADAQRSVQFTASRGLVARADPSLMRVVLENLLGNAWKFTALRPKARIELGMTSSCGTQTFFVRDNGAGFDPQYADKLFKAFQRLHSSEVFPGTGIGLTIVQRIIQRHAGQVWAEGAIEQGATFYFSLRS